MKQERDYKWINRPVMKKDAQALLTGQPVYTQDLAPADCLIVKALRSPHANAMVVHVDTTAAQALPGIECILTYEDVPQTRFTTAGQTYPELSPYDKLILDPHVRYVGDPVALVAGVDAKAVDKALRFIKVDYDVLPAVLDFHAAKDNPVIVHPEADWNPRIDVGGDHMRNIVARASDDWGDLEALTIESDKHLVEDFAKVCESQRLSMNEVINQLMHSYVKQHTAM